LRRLVLAAALLAALPALARTTPPKFRWPVMGKAEKSADGRGLDIAAPVGEAVHTGGDGDVIYARDEIASFGKMVVVKHASGYVTTYAHLSEIAVREGAAVKRGDIIGKAGHTGEAKASGVYFELRLDSRTLDPIGYLAPR
jgi:murein DD-endopeptidase MepM/ murein hydrolase activator NlpD